MITGHRDFWAAVGDDALAEYEALSASRAGSVASPPQPPSEAPVLAD